MSVETPEKPQTEEREQQCEESEKCQKCKEKQEFENELYDGITKFIKSESFLKERNGYLMEVKNSDEGLPRFYQDLVRETKIEDKDLLWEFLAAVTAADQVAECIIEEVSRRAFAVDYLEKNINKDDYFIIKSTEGEKVGVALCPYNVIEEHNLDTDEKIIEFHKNSMPNVCFDNAKFEIIRGEAFDEEFAKSKDLLLKTLKGEK